MELILICLGSKDLYFSVGCEDTQRAYVQIISVNENMYNVPCILFSDMSFYFDELLVMTIY